MRSTTQILHVPFDTVTMKAAVKKAIAFLEDGGQHIICTPNPEIVMQAQTDRELMEILKASDMVVPDGIGIVWASRFSQTRLTERVAGYDLAIKLLEQLKNTDKTVFFFGGAPGVASAAAKKMMRKYEGLNIVGTRNGYFNQKEEQEIISQIKKLHPDLLLVGLGSPKQEKWIYDNLRLTGAKVSIGIGGSFDVMAGNVKRAPKIFQRLGLEWFYRFLCQPTRLKRILKLPQFIIAVIKNR